MKKANQSINFLGSAILAQGVTKSKLFNDLKKDFVGTGDKGPAGAADAGELIIRVVQILLLISASLAVVFLVIGGIQYVLSRGNEEAAEKAKKTMTAAVWGLAVIIMAFAIVFIISSALISGRGGLGI